MNFKPKLRQEAQINLRASLAGLIENLLKSEFPFQNCLNCARFNEKTEQCGQWNAKPPARVIAYGCDKHEDIDEIPF